MCAEWEVQSLVCDNASVVNIPETADTFGRVTFTLSMRRRGGYY